MNRLIAAALGTTFAAMPALAADPMQLTYEEFEASVLHSDLENCPADLANEDWFCRLTLHNDELHVFAFSYRGKNPLMAFKTYSSEHLGEALK